MIGSYRNTPTNRPLFRVPRSLSRFNVSTLQRSTPNEPGLPGSSGCNTLAPMAKVLLVDDDLTMVQMVADSSVPSEDRGYTYDSAWNLAWLTNNGALSQFIVDNKNQLTNAYTAENTYDSNGNLLTANYTRDVFYYNDENELIQYYHFQNGIDSPTTGDTRTDFIYDGLMRLRHRLEYTFTCTGGVEQTSAQLAGEGLGTPTNCISSLPLETYYIYDGWRVIQERDGTGAPTVSYTRGNDLSGSMEGAGGIGGLLARSSGYSGGNFTTHNFYFADGNGNITYMLNSSQAMVASYRYDPIGNTISSSGTLANANVYRFSSKEIHANSGMYYYGYRFYDPNLQRWINRDPVTEDGFSLAFQKVSDSEGNGEINLYGFVENNPLLKSDALGLDLYFTLCPLSHNCRSRIGVAVAVTTYPIPKIVGTRCCTAANQLFGSILVPNLPLDVIAAEAFFKRCVSQAKK